MALSAALRAVPLGRCSRRGTRPGACAGLGLALPAALRLIRRASPLVNCNGGFRIMPSRPCTRSLYMCCPSNNSSDEKS
eukprot:5234446-Lingulodinium_polyedra.AAC.1